MASSNHERAHASLQKHVTRLQTALRKQDRGTLDELVLPSAPKWMLDARATRRAGLGRVSSGVSLQSFNRYMLADVVLSFRAPWSARDRIVVTEHAVSLDRGASWRFIDGVPDFARVMGDPAYRWLAQAAANNAFVSGICVSFGGGRVGVWAPAERARSVRERHERLLERMRRAIPSSAGRAKALVFLKTVVRRYQCALPAGARRAARNARQRPLSELALSPSHLEQLRTFAVGWDDAENGAPMLVPPRAAPDTHANEQARLLAAFEILLALGRLPPGIYRYDQKNVTISTAHARLFPFLSVSWDGGDGPSVDPKRPYGRRSDYHHDMADLLGIEPGGVADEEGPNLTPAQEKELTKLHGSMASAIGALLLHGRLKPGKFRKVRGEWKRVES